VAEPLHALFGPEQRVKRAGEHIEALGAHIQEWTNLHGDSNYIEFEATPEGLKTKATLPIAELGRASVLIGDALFNLRAALDYLVYVLAVANNKGRHVSGTQFPIEESMEMFHGRVTGTTPGGRKVKQYLKHVPPSAVRRIQQLQPCWDPSVEWTRRLRELSNPDKHQNLTALQSRAHFRPEPGPLRFESEGKATVRGNFEVQVFFRESSESDEDAFDTLEVLHGHVAALIDEFKPAFTGSEDRPV
jgi:hypothetical protein